MSEESTTPDLVELVVAFFEAANRRDFDAVMSFYALDPVWESMGMATRFEGVTAIRGFHEDFISAYEEYRAEPEEILDLGNGVTFCVIVQQGRPYGSPAESQVQSVYGFVLVWTDCKVARVTVYTDIDEARAAAERLAEERA